MAGWIHTGRRKEGKPQAAGTISSASNSQPASDSPSRSGVASVPSPSAAQYVQSWALFILQQPCAWSRALRRPLLCPRSVRATDSQVMPTAAASLPTDAACYHCGTPHRASPRPAGLAVVAALAVLLFDITATSAQSPGPVPPVEVAALAALSTPPRARPGPRTAAGPAGRTPARGSGLACSARAPTT